MNMRELSSQKYWEELLSRSEKEPVIIYKHSSTCSISLAAYNRLKVLEQNQEISDHIYLVVVQNSPEISADIADKLEVKHESPQVLLISNGRAVYHASHQDIESEALLGKYDKIKAVA
jgi:bacillithiol system protein YtxJ